MCGEHLTMRLWLIIVMAMMIIVMMVILTMMTMMLSGGISNLYMCKGETGKVIEVKASERKGEQASLTQVLLSHHVYYTTSNDILKTIMGNQTKNSGFEIGLGMPSRSGGKTG